MTITIKAASHADRSDWKKLWAENRVHFGAGDMKEAVIAGLWQRVLDPSSPMNAWLAFRAGEPVGLAHTILHPHTFSLRLACYLEDLWVSPLHRGRGIATRLIGHLSVLGGQEGWRRLYWETAEDNAGARRLYDRVATLRPMATYEIELAH